VLDQIGALGLAGPVYDVVADPAKGVKCADGLPFVARQQLSSPVEGAAMCAGYTLAVGIGAFQDWWVVRGNAGHGCARNGKVSFLCA
jgi:hypothetical protein